MKTHRVAARGRKTAALVTCHRAPSYDASRDPSRGRTTTPVVPCRSSKGGCRPRSGAQEGPCCALHPPCCSPSSPSAPCTAPAAVSHALRLAGPIVGASACRLLLRA